MAEENRRRDSELRPSCVRLQCLRCRSEFTPSEEVAGGRGRRGGPALLPEGVDERDDEELTEFNEDVRGERG